MTIRWSPGCPSSPARKLQQKRAQLLEEEDEEAEDEEVEARRHPLCASAPSSIFIEGVEYKVEKLDSRRPPSPTASWFPEPDRQSGSQRNSLEEALRAEQRPSSAAGVNPALPRGGDVAVPVRTAKAERRHQERLRVHSPELLGAQEKKELSPAERRALEAEKRAMWRAARPGTAAGAWDLRLAVGLFRMLRPARMKSLEQDALKAQMVIAKSKEGRKRSTLEQLAESPSPAPTPSPTPVDELDTVIQMGSD
ncbi:hypothetical protein EYD10_16111 [Varanus komodoensis]|nr:hypothetical protein EYD10_16111 [Varanus komodoensis]